MTEEVTTNEVVEYEENVNGAGIGGIAISTFGKSIEESKRAYSVVNSSEYLHEGLMNKELQVTNVILERGERRSRETGELVECVNSYICTADGKSYFTQSAGIARGLASIYRLVPDFKDAEGNPIKIMIKSKKLNNGNTLKVVEWV